MLIEKVSRKKERFWAMNLLFTALLMAAFYSLNHSAVLLKLFMAHAPAVIGEDTGMQAAKAVHGVLKAGPGFLWGYGIVFAVAYIFKRTREQLREGMLIVAGFEAVLLLVRILAFAKGAMDPAPYIAVAAGNGIAFLAVLIHERMLI